MDLFALTAGNAPMTMAAFTGLVACTTCDTVLARAVRAAVFGPDFGSNLLATVLPVIVFAAIVAILSRSPARRERDRS